MRQYVTGSPTGQAECGLSCEETYSKSERDWEPTRPTLMQAGVDDGSVSNRIRRLPPGLHRTWAAFARATRSCAEHSKALGQASSSTVSPISMCSNTEHIENDREELERAAARLRPGGRVIVLAPAHQWLFTPFDAAIAHFRRYNRSMMRNLRPPGCNWSRSGISTPPASRSPPPTGCFVGSQCRRRRSFRSGTAMLFHCHESSIHSSLAPSENKL